MYLLSALLFLCYVIYHTYDTYVLYGGKMSDTFTCLQPEPSSELIIYLCTYLTSRSSNRFFLLIAARFLYDKIKSVHFF